MLSARILRPPGRQLLSKHSTIPAQPLIRPRTRAFHATAPRKDAVLDALLYLPHEMMSMIHTQLPWYATIPLTAFLVRGLLVTTAGSYVRSLTARYIGTQPLRQAITYQKRKELAQKGGFDNPRQAKLTIARAVSKETSALDERWKCTIWGQLNWTFAQIPIFFTMAEAIRQMCGARDGILKMSLNRFSSSSTAERLDGVEQTGVEQPGIELTNVELTDPNPWLQPSLADEGMLWFPDLLQPDPILPFITSGVMFANIYMSKNGLSADPEKAPRLARVVRYTLMAISLTIGPMCQGFPAALMLYWVSSTTSVILWNFWLDWRHPAPRDFMACKRPLQLLAQPRPLKKVAPPPPPLARVRGKKARA